jgi:hypothetical protein
MTYSLRIHLVTYIRCIFTGNSTTRSEKKPAINCKGACNVNQNIPIGANRHGIAHKNDGHDSENHNGLTKFSQFGGR